MINGMVREVFWNFDCFQYKVKIIADNPMDDEIEKNIIYVVGIPDKYIKWAYLKCPCGCQDIIMLSLDTKQFPSWVVKQSKFGQATIFPSIDKLDGCKSHFWIKRGKVIWFKGKNE